MSDSALKFSTAADLDAAKIVAEKCAKGGAALKPIGKEVLESLDEGSLPESTYERLARMCHNKNVDHKRNVLLAKELSNFLFGEVIKPSK